MHSPAGSHVHSSTGSHVHSLAQSHTHSPARSHTALQETFSWEDSNSPSIHHWRYGCSLYGMSHTPCSSRLYVSLLLLYRLLSFPPSSSTKSMILTSDFSFNHPYKWALLSCLSQNSLRTGLSVPIKEQLCFKNKIAIPLFQLFVGILLFVVGKPLQPRSGFFSVLKRFTGESSGRLWGHAV